MDDVKNLICETLGLEKIDTYHFKKLYGLTFVIKHEEVSMKGYITSAEIGPVGIIYDENGEFYFAPLSQSVEIEEVVKKYVEKMVI